MTKANAVALNDMELDMVAGGNCRQMMEKFCEKLSQAGKKIWELIYKR